ncbi:MAG: hypothetical protein ABFS34_05620 [Gemmatimonadota bacterium]
MYSLVRTVALSSLKSLILAGLAAAASHVPALSQSSAPVVEPGSGVATGAKLAPYAARFSLTRVGPGGTETPAGAWTDEVKLMGSGERAVLWRRVERFDAQGVSELVRVQSADLATMAPLRTHQVGPNGTVIHVDYEADSLRSVLIPSPDGAALTARTEAMAAFDLSLYAVLLRSLPLEDGYTASVAIAAMAPGGAVQLVQETVRVTGREQVSAGGITADAWVVETSLIPWKVWLWDDAPYIARFEQPNPDGTITVSTLVGE